MPRCANNDAALCATPFTPDTAHQPSLAYLPYLVTGDHFYLEEMQFWSAWNPLGTAAGYRGFEKGLLNFDQVRAQGWSLRTLAQNAFIAPDNDPLKAYFSAQLQFNADDYNQNYVNNPQANKLGWLSNGGENIAPWMDDFATWAVGHAVELGFENYRPLLQWKAQFPIGRMVAPGTCWIFGAAYSMRIGVAATGQVFTTFQQAYEATVLLTPGDSVLLTYPCGGQEMATYLKLQVGEMTGYSSSATGFPSNLQPALAAAADSGIANGGQAWTVFMNRTVKPNYAIEPQFAIIPR